MGKREDMLAAIERAKNPTRVMPSADLVTEPPADDCQAMRRGIEDRIKAAKKPKRKSMFKRDRLPDGSFYHAVFSESAQKWVGSLHIPYRGESLVFRAEHRAVFMLLQALDDQWRHYLERLAQTNTNSAVNPSPTPQPETTSEPQ